MELLDRLVELGYERCGHAANGEQALHGIAQTCPDAVLMDVHLGPGPDSIDTTRQLQRNHDIPVVFLTAYCDAALMARDSQWQGEARARRRDGRSFHEGLSLTLLPQGGLVCVCRDISRQKLNEQTLVGHLAAQRANARDVRVDGGPITVDVQTQLAARG